MNADSLSLKTSVTFCLTIGLVFSASCIAQTVRHVPSEYSTIQSAITASVDGDEVLVAPGTYFETIDFLGREIEVRSEQGPEVTVIDALFKDSVVTIGDNIGVGALVEGFTIKNGRPKDTLWAGGIRVGMASSPTIRGNIIRNNLGYGSGNGVSLSHSAAPIVENNRIIENQNASGIWGGGGGGGIGITGSSCSQTPGCGAVIIGNYIAHNSIDYFSSGGGIFSNGGGALQIIGNIIEENTAPNDGGAISFINGGDALVANNLMLHNEAGNEGGAVRWIVPWNERGPFMIGNTLIDNVAPNASAVFLDGHDVASRLINNLIVSGSGSSAVHCGTFNDPFPPLVRHNNVYTTTGIPFSGLCKGAVGVEGNISQQPLFVGPSNYRLAKESPGIDAGANAFVNTEVDLDGNPRIMDGNHDDKIVVDIGAYESDALFEDGFEI